MERLYKYIPEARQGKAHVDHIIDLCGTPKEGGTGLQNLRECIQWTEEKFNFEPKLKKVSCARPNFMQNISPSFFSHSGNKCPRILLSGIVILSCLQHISERGHQGTFLGMLSLFRYDLNFRDLDISFTLWMDIRAEIREIIVHGARDFNFM